MTTRSRSPSGPELVDEASNWAVGGGIVTMALFPLALPILALTAIALLPLLLPLLAAGLIAAIAGAPVLLVRRLRRHRRGQRPNLRDPSQTRISSSDARTVKSASWVTRAAS